MSFQEFIEFGATLSALVVSVVEAIKYGFLKNYFKNAAVRFKWSQDQAQNYYVAVLMLLSVFVGVLVALGAGPQANILTQLGFRGVVGIAGYVLTGVLLAFGNLFWTTVLDATKAITDVLKVWRDKQSADLYPPQE